MKNSKIIIAIGMLLLFFSCLGQSEKTVVYRDERNVIIPEKTVVYQNIFKKLTYEDDNLKLIEVYFNDFIRKDSLGNPKSKLKTVEIYDVPNDQKATERAKYPEESWTFSVYFGTTKKINHYTFYHKERESEPGLIEVIEELDDETGLIVFESFYKIKSGKAGSKETHKILYDGKGDMLLFAVFARRSRESKYAVFDGTSRALLETFPMDKFAEMKQKYFRNSDLSYFEYPEMEPLKD